MIFAKIQGLGVAVLATLGLLASSGASPALAYIFRGKFCGSFGDGSGQVNASWVDIDTEQSNGQNDYGIVDAFISTTRNNITVEYEFDDLISSGKNTSSSNVFPQPYTFALGESVYWTFQDFENDGNQGGFFNLVFPIADFDNIVNSTKGDSISFAIPDNAEFRVIGFAKDPDQLVSVPEPNTIVSLVGLGLIGFVKGIKKRQK